MQWKQLEDYDYEISTDGQVRHTKHKKVRKTQPNSNGYPKVSLYNKTTGKYQTIPIHRLMAKAYLNLEIGQVVDHINRNRNDPRLENLRAISQSENGKNRSHCKTCTCLD